MLLKKALFMSVVAGSFLIASPAMAADGGASYLDEATQALQSSVLYVSPSVSDLSTDQQAELSAQIGNSSIAMVVLPAGAQSDIGSIPSFISQLASRTDYETIFVSVGADFDAGSSVLSSGQASQLANSAEGQSLDGGLQQFVEQVKAEQPSGASGASHGPFTFIISFGVGIVGALVLTIAVMTVRRSFRGRNRNVLTSNEESYDDGKLSESRETPKEIRDLLNKIERQLDGLKQRNLQVTLLKADRDVHELFKRLRKRMPDTVQQTTGRYKGILSSVNQVVERYIDIQNNPLYFASSEKKAQPLLENGAQAMGQYVEGVLQNIRDIEAGALTEFNVDMKILEATVREETPEVIKLRKQD